MASEFYHFAQMKTDLLNDKSFRFSVRILKLVEVLPPDRRADHIGRQIMRSATSIGAQIREAQHGESRQDFVQKLSLAQKEANETLYWLELLHAVELLGNKGFQSLHHHCLSLYQMITRSIITCKRNRTN